MKKWHFIRSWQALILIVLFLSWSITPAQADCGTLGASSGSVVDATTDTPDVFEDTGAQVTVDLGTQTGDVLVVSAFNSRSSQNAITGSWRISSTTAGDSLPVDRQISSNSDFGIGSVVYLAENITGLQTFKLQHQTDSNSVENITSGTIVAVPLITSGGAALNNGFITTVASYSTDLTDYSPVPNTTTSVNLPATGDIYVVAAFNSSSGIGQSTTGEWKLQYRPQSGTWSDLGRPSKRLHSGNDDIGVVSLTALIKNQPSDTYEFRLVASAVDGRNIDTFNVSLAAVALAYDNGGTPGYFPAFQVDAGSYPINPASVRQIALEKESAVSSDTGAQAFFGAQFQMDSVTGATDFTLDLAVDNDITNNSEDLIRLLANSGDVGNGGAVWLSNPLTAGTNHAFQLRAEANSLPANLTNPVLVVIGLTCREDYSPTAISLTNFNANTAGRSYILFSLYGSLLLSVLFWIGNRVKKSEMSNDP